MGIFSKNKSKDSDFLGEISFQIGEGTSDGESGLAPHALTSDEILSGSSQSNSTGESAPENPLEEMRKRMVENAKKRSDPTTQPPPEPTPTPVSQNAPTENNEDFFNELMNQTQKSEIFVQKEEAPAPTDFSDQVPKTSEESIQSVFEMIDNISDPPEKEIPNADETLMPLEKMPKRDGTAPIQKSDQPLPPANPSAAVARTVLPPKPENPVALQENPETLLKRCMPFIVDENGRNVSENEQPLYQLESVADILHAESMRTLEKLKENYDISANFDSALRDLAGNSGKCDKKETVPAAETAREAKPIFEEEPDDLPDVSDIDTAVLPRGELPPTDFSNTATVRFTPIKKADGNTDRISISTMTRAIDLTGEIGELATEPKPTVNPAPLQESEFEAFVPSADDNTEQPKVLLRRLSIRKRNAFLQMVGSGLVAVLSFLFLLPGLRNLLITDARKPMAYLAVALGMIILINLDVFAAFRHIIHRRFPTDCFAGVVAFSGLLLSVAAFRKNSNAEQTYTLLCCVAVVLALRTIGKFMRASAIVGNYRVIAQKNPKNAIMLLDDPSATFAMANNAVDGNALIALPRPAETVSDFMKHSEFSTVLDGKLRIVFWVSFALALLVGFAASAEFKASIYGFYAATAIFCITATPMLFFLDTLPTYHAATHLNKKGAMIAGRAAAERLEDSNAIVLSSRELFPDGTVTLHDMRVLENNNVDQILVRAAALTEAVNSPLTPIFKEIADTNESYKLPDSDTVKYEDRLGLSGWVDDELLFVGNRTLMEAHGIEVPDIEVDRRILRSGYFPVYIACKDRACALLSIQYATDGRIASQLRKMVDLGVVLLVNNCDPNMTAEMICDYFGLYDESVRVMSNSGVHAFKNSVTPVMRQSAPAAFRNNPISLVEIINCASRMRRSNLILTVLYVLCACVGAVLFVYLTFTGSGIPNGKNLLIWFTASGILSYLIYLIKKP